MHGDALAPGGRFHYPPLGQRLLVSALCGGLGALELPMERSDLELMGHSSGGGHARHDCGG